MKLLKTPDARMEVLRILEAQMLERQPDMEDYHCGIQRMSSYYRQRCELSKAQTDQWFHPLLKIEQHVIRKLKLSEALLTHYFDAPADVFSPAAILALAHGQKLSRDEAQALVLLLLDSAKEAHTAAAALGLPDFIAALQQLALPDSYRWQLVELCSNWDTHQQIVEEILSRGVELFNEVAPLAQPLIDQWYETVSRHLAGGPYHLQVGSASILLNSDRDYTIRPALNACNSVSTIGLDFGDNPPVSPCIYYGVLCDLISERIGQLQQSDTALLRGLRALGDKQRLRIVRALAETPHYSGELVKLTGLSPATITHHMSELVGAGLVTMEDAGSRVIYHINRDGVSRLSAAIQSLIQ